MSQWEAVNQSPPLLRNSKFYVAREVNVQNGVINFDQNESTSDRQSYGEIGLNTYVILNGTALLKKFSQVPYHYTRTCLFKEKANFIEGEINVLWIK